jgi:hypothetical protein
MLQRRHDVVSLLEVDSEDEDEDEELDEFLQKFKLDVEKYVAR